jgi:hypothetical protein
MAKWTQNQLDELQRSYLLIPNTELAVRIGKSVTAIKQKCHKLGLTKRRFLTATEKQYINEHYATTNTRDLATYLQRSLYTIHNYVHRVGLKKDTHFVQQHRKTLVLKAGTHTRFKKGHIPANKGVKMNAELRERLKHTFYQKGNIPGNTLPIGSEIITKQWGYVKVKIAEPNKWVLKHRQVWEQHHGTIPKGNIIRFKDGNRKNCDINNLYILSRNDHLKYENGVEARYPEDVKKLIHLKGELTRQIRKAQKKE